MDRTANTDDVFHNEDVDEADTSEQTRLLPLTTVSAAEPSVPRPLTSQPVIQNPSRTYKSDSEMYEELILRVLRPAGAALGISIAGGDGSTPYRSNDGVCYGVFLFVYSNVLLHFCTIMLFFKHIHFSSQHRLSCGCEFGSFRKFIAIFPEIC